MKRHTQTGIANCWQTAVACVLEVSPEALPDQMLIEGENRSYHNALCEYLVRHHGLVYMELHTSWQTDGLLVVSNSGYHVLIGPTVRTKDNGAHHVIVGRQGTPVWDVHPSRDGLLEVQTWGLLPKVSEAFVAQRQATKAVLDDPSSFYCYCPDCGGV